MNENMYLCCTTKLSVMEQTLQLCPVGIQTFSEIRTKNYLYVDKTALVYRLTHGAPKSVFLSRPRRFGKSLLLSTLQSYFEGRRELFEGLAIEQLEKEWTSYPVLRFDMRKAEQKDPQGVAEEIDKQLSDYEEKYGCEPGAVLGYSRLSFLVKHIYRQLQKQVVILIDAYDAPLINRQLSDEERDSIRDTLDNKLYFQLKPLDSFVHFVFLTGETKFYQDSIYSGLNNLTYISLDARYAAICGITEEEMLTQMSGHIDQMAQTLGCTREEMIEKLKRKYDGYHFTWPSPDIYNPFSLLNAFDNEEINDYWFGSGTPTYLIEMMRKFHVLPMEIGNVKARASSFDAPTEQMTNIIPLLYQSGYLTIKDYNPYAQMYWLDIPNSEIRTGLMESLLPNYLHRQKDEGLTTVGLMYDAIRQEKMDDALRLLQTFLSTVPYTDHIKDSEGHYQQMLYVIFSLFGWYVDVEVRTPVGRVDMVLRTATTLYIVELKLNQSAEAAMNQIDLKQYPERFRLTGLPIVKVGINFDAERHTLKDWVIEQA